MLWAAFILGLVSSFHCVGMCGPLAMAVPVGELSPFKKTMAIFLYHTARVFTYTLLGLLFGMLGRHLFVASYQQWISISLGLVILLLTLGQKIFAYKRVNFISGKITRVLTAWMRYIWNRHSLFGTFVFGALNGLLPCGMVYYALAGAFGMGSLFGGIYFMLLFGLGTLPLMIAVHFLGTSYLNFSLRNKMRKLVPVFIACMGLILILRGLNLGIPYLSPFIGNSPSQAVICH